MTHHTQTLDAGRTSRADWRRRMELLRIAWELGKFRITFVVCISALTGYVMHAGRINAGALAPVLGVFLLASGASALNQCQEARFDALMKRTRRRPIPSGRISPAGAFFIAGTMVLLGLYGLASAAHNEIAVFGLGLLALGWYSLIYTCLKRITAFAVVPGAVIGAIPPLIGWTAAGGHPADPVILAVALFFFIWQIPHFWLLALMHSEDYDAAGFPLLTRTFSRPQICRITYMWLVATAVAGLAIPGIAPGVVQLPWNLLLAAAAVWLALRGLALVDHARREARGLGVGLPSDNVDATSQSLADPQKALFLRVFLQINVYMMVVMICLILSALAWTFR